MDNSHTLLIGVQNGKATLENILAVSYKCKHLSYTPSIPPLDNLPQRNRHVFTQRPACQYSYQLYKKERAKTGYNSKYLSTGEWINKRLHINLLICYSAIKKNDSLIHATAWMNLKTIC